MKTTIIALTALIALTSTAQAGYRIVIPMEQSKGGALPNGSISIKPRTPSLPAESWRVTDPLYSEWTNKGDIYGCNWTPAASLVLRDEPLNQTAIDCKQDQIRTKQDREQETTTFAFRNIGTPTTENKTTNSISDRTKTAIGTATCIFNQDDGNTATKTQWFVNINADNHLLQVNGNTLYNGQGKYSTTLIINGKTYKRGNIKATTNNYLGQPDTNFHEVCK